MKRLLVLLFGLLLPGVAHAASPEALCSDPDTILCRDFESDSNCTTGQENLCWQDNGFTNRVGQWTIKTDGAGAVGDGYAEVKPKFGGPSGGAEDISFTGVDDIECRYYVRYSPEFVSYQDHHMPLPMRAGGGGCERGGTLEGSQFNYNAYFATNGNAACGYTSEINLAANQSNIPVIRNSYWNLVETRAKIDTSCTNSTAAHGCNGIFQQWINGTKTHDYSDVNFGGVASSNTVKWNKVRFPDSYFHIGWGPHPDHLQNMQIDGLICRKVAGTIGSASPENARGTATGTYMATYIGWNGIGRQAGDCWSSGDANRYQFNYGENWRDADGGGIMTLDSTIVDDDSAYHVQSECVDTYATADKSLKIVAAPGQGGGRAQTHWRYPNGSGGYDYYPTYSMRHRVYFPSTNDYSKGTATFGWRAYESNTAGRFIAATISNNKWALVLKYTPDEGNAGTTPQTVIESTTNAVFDQWVWAEILVWRDDHTVTLRINGVKVFDHQSLAAVTDVWKTVFAAQSGGQSLVLGVINHPSTASGSFTVYYDNASAGSPSFESCDGWEEADCPFTEEGPGPTSTTTTTIPGDHPMRGAGSRPGSRGHGRFFFLAPLSMEGVWARK